MPELPEVETMRRYLENHIVGQTIIDILILNPNSLLHDTSFDANVIQGKRITHLDRVGKKLLIYLTDNLIIAVHFKMSGSFYIREEGEVDEHDRVILKLSSMNLNFHDPRKFGKILITREINKALYKIGVDALSENLDASLIYSIFSSHNMVIKRLLLDQSFIAGIGNIYADEILYASRIHPLTNSRRITKATCEELLINMKRILNLSIRYQGT
ncbi:MAG: DNA-formamidopyrimidine glycosylase, partial [Spirochaetia bacterium]|nr:DNA-formamidopyrimidine glycosylase [Spirochaetia bacterium]